MHTVSQSTPLEMHPPLNSCSEAMPRHQPCQHVMLMIHPLILSSCVTSCQNFTILLKPTRLMQHITSKDHTTNTYNKRVSKWVTLYDWMCQQLANLIPNGRGLESATTTYMISDGKMDKTTHINRLCKWIQLAPHSVSHQMTPPMRLYGIHQWLNMK